MIFLSRILVTTDLSGSSLTAVEYASSLATLYGSKLYLLYVCEHVAKAGIGVWRDGHSSLHEGCSADPKGDLAELIASSIDPAITFIPVVRCGNPADIIIRFAEEERMNIIVMAARGRKGSEDRQLGNTAEKVVRRSTVPVLTVKPSPLGENLIENDDIESQLHLRGSKFL